MHKQILQKIFSTNIKIFSSKMQCSLIHTNFCMLRAFFLIIFIGRRNKRIYLQDWNQDSRLYEFFEVYTRHTQWTEALIQQDLNNMTTRKTSAIYSGHGTYFFIFFLYFLNLFFVQHLKEIYKKKNIKMKSKVRNYEIVNSTKLPAISFTFIITYTFLFSIIFLFYKA